MNLIVVDETRHIDLHGSWCCFLECLHEHFLLCFVPEPISLLNVLHFALYVGPFDIICLAQPNHYLTLDVLREECYLILVKDKHLDLGGVSHHAQLGRRRLILPRGRFLLTLSRH